MTNISFIIPVYNREELIGKVIDSIKKSAKLKDYEIIAVDDNSSDNTLNELKRYKEIRIIQNDVNKGPAVCRNQGILASKGKYLFLVDSDVFLTKDCFEKVYKAIQKKDISFPMIIFEDETRMYPSNENEEKFLKASTVFMIRKDSLKKLDEIFDADYYMVEEDTDFFLRCKMFGLKCTYASGAKAYHALEPKFSLNLERKYYFTTKNHIYSWLKLSGLDNKAINLFSFPSAKLVLKDLIIALFNINLLSITSVEGRTKTKQTFYDKINMFLGKHPKVTSKSRLLLVYLFIKAVTWNVLHTGKTLKKKRVIKKKLTL